MRQNLYQWLLNTKKREFGGVNFEKNPPPLELAKALAIQDLNGDKNQKPEDKTAWAVWIGGFIDPGSTKKMIMPTP